MGSPPGEQAGAPAVTPPFREIENRWRRAWQRADCHRAPRHPDGPCFFVHDSAPFPNGALHLGHVRTYVLGDVQARYHRMLGQQVLYVSGFDAFGLPIELEAIARGLSPHKLVLESMATMSRQLDRLGISYDRSLIQCTSDPECYRHTQWLFLEMFEAGLIERREAELPWCPRCETSLARLQIEDGGCWRCGTTVGQRPMAQWFVLTSRYREELLLTGELLDGWSRAAKGLLRGLLRDPGDWLVSRQRSWGTPIPLVYCDRCGVVPVPRLQLPVRLPDELDWAGGSGALKRHPEFARTDCPRCGAAARRETDTLDCFFDDIWCFMQCLVVSGDPPGFSRENLLRWLPADLCQCGFDTASYFNLYRLLGRFLAERGLIDDPETIRQYHGNGMVMAGGRKMSKHLGNAVSPEQVLDEHGADALRVALLWAAEPKKDISWTEQLLDRAGHFLRDSERLFGPGLATLTGDVGTVTPTRAADRLVRRADGHLGRVSAFLRSYRPHAALSVLAQWNRDLSRFCSARLPAQRLQAADAVVLRRELGRYARALGPFAPFLAEECWHRLGNESLLAHTAWPEREGTEPAEPPDQ